MLNIVSTLCEDWLSQCCLIIVSGFFLTFSQLCPKLYPNFVPNFVLIFTSGLSKTNMFISTRYCEVSQLSHSWNLSNKSDYQSQIFKGSVPTLQVAKITFSHFRLQYSIFIIKRNQIEFKRIVILLPFMAKTSNSSSA